MAVTNAEQERAAIAAAAEARRAARVANLAKWAAHELPLWFVGKPGMLQDILKDAQRVADNTGIPQRVRTTWDRETYSVVEPDKTVCEATGAVDRMPRWVKEEMGW